MRRRGSPKFLLFLALPERTFCSDKLQFLYNNFIYVELTSQMTWLIFRMEVQEKTTSVIAASATVGLSIHKGKNKILRYNTTCTNQITLDGEDLKGVKTSTYLSSMIDEHSASDAHMKLRISKARAAYLQLKNICNSKQLSSSQHRGQNFQYKCQDSSILIISGLVGTCICFQHRIPSISPQLMNIIQIISGILSLSCFIICLTTSIYTGKKGSLIASYDNTCKMISIEQLLEQRQQQQQQQQHHTQQQQHHHPQQHHQPQEPQQQLTFNTKIINNSISNNKSFLKPCCIELIKNICECYINYNKRIEYYHHISCHLLFSSIKDYIILQSALMCIGCGVSL
ncbi:unnamed protein product [Schistosoma mattheei]|uniref:Uncharacterized protein n=1 Tax=Schistosoma mattheei TaxID=31246 RepID=A0A183NWU8_9TREM|nr:unnamed protein product [Schistosoma mattheei]